MTTGTGSKAKATKPVAKVATVAKPRATAKTVPATTTPAAPLVEAAPVIAATPVVEQPVAEAAETVVTATAAADAPAQSKELFMDATTTINDAATTIDTAATEATAKGQAYFAEFNDRAKAAMEKGSKAVEEMNEFGKGNVEAIVESSKIAAKGLETLGQGYAEYSRKSFEGATAMFKSFAAVKTPAEFMQLHTDYMRSQFDSIVAETSKNTEAMIKLAGDIAQPISNRVAVAAEKIKVAA